MLHVLEKALDQEKFTSEQSEARRHTQSMVCKRSWL